MINERSRGNDVLLRDHGAVHNLLKRRAGPPGRRHADGNKGGQG
jgi:hypothetical protein